jgi:hypothetical protein
MVKVIDVSVPEHVEKPPPDQDPNYEVISCDEEGDGYDISEIVDILGEVESTEASGSPQT